MTLNEFLKRAMSPPVPWVRDGRDFAGWDCWGLIVCAFREVKGVTLPSYDRKWITPLRHLRALENERERWRETAEPEPMDVVLMNFRGRPVHVGLVIGAGRVLHCDRTVETVIERMFEKSAPGRVEGIYRHAA